ncbi:Protein-UDP acetylgalactosaminyltransferase [Dirofilaria immitis]|nr:Protein-UDP acetylgalactosaminyltransferase [Dirofilaria immitis]
MPGSQSVTVVAGNSANSYYILDGSDSQNADMMDFDDGSGPTDPRFEKQQQQLLHADFYNDFGDLFDNVKRAMSIKRRWFELQRFFRHWSSLLSLFAICFLLLVFTLAYNLNQSQEIVEDYMKYDYKIGVFVRGRKVKTNEKLLSNKESKNWKKYVDFDDELPGDPDPDTVFKLGEIGNFEPKEAQAQAGNFGEMGEPVLVDKTLPEVKKR